MTAERFTPNRPLAAMTLYAASRSRTSVPESMKGDLLSDEMFEGMLFSFYTLARVGTTEEIRNALRCLLFACLGNQKRYCQLYRACEDLLALELMPNPLTLLPIDEVAGFGKSLFGGHRGAGAGLKRWYRRFYSRLGASGLFLQLSKEFYACSWGRISGEVEHLVTKELPKKIRRRFHLMGVKPLVGEWDKEAAAQIFIYGKTNLPINPTSLLGRVIGWVNASSGKKPILGMDIPFQCVVGYLLRTRGCEGTLCFLRGLSPEDVATAIESFGGNVYMQLRSLFNPESKEQLEALRVFEKTRGAFAFTHDEPFISSQPVQGGNPFDDAADRGEAAFFSLQGGYVHFQLGLDFIYVRDVRNPPDVLLPTDILFFGQRIREGKMNTGGIIFTDGFGFWGADLREEGPVLRSLNTFKKFLASKQKPPSAKGSFCKALMQANGVLSDDAVVLWAFVPDGLEGEDSSEKDGDAECSAEGLSFDLASLRRDSGFENFKTVVFVNGPLPLTEQIINIVGEELPRNTLLMGSGKYPYKATGIREVRRLIAVMTLYRLWAPASEEDLHPYEPVALSALAGNRGRWAFRDKKG